MKLALLLPLLALTAARDINREKREATPLFGNVVRAVGSAVTSPFRGFLNLVGLSGASSGQKEPEKKPSSSYGAPSYHAPAPAPAYHAPAPSYSAPAPVVVVHHAPKPEIHVLPAPDLSHGPASVDTYGSPAAPSYSAPALDTYGAAASPPVYTPISNNPAPVDVVPTIKLVDAPVEILPAVEIDPLITKAPLNVEDHDEALEVQEADIVDLRTAAEPRQPKAISGDSGKKNQVVSEQGKALQGQFVPVDTDLIIDLTENKEAAPVEVESPAVPPAFEGDAPAPAPEFEEPAAQIVETTAAPVKTTEAPTEPTTIRVIHFTREPVSSPGDTFFRTSSSDQGFGSELVQQSAQLRIETTEASVDVPATSQAIVETPAPAPAFVQAVQETVAPVSSETPAPAPAFEESPAPAPAFTTTITASTTTEASTELETEATTTGSPVTPILPGESLRAAVAVNLSEEPAKEALDYEVLALVDEVEEEIKTTAAAALATEAPVVRKVFFEIVESSAGEEAENPNVAPTLAAIPEAISADPVFQEITRDATANEQQKRGFRAYDPRQSQVYAHKYNDANSNWYYFRRGY